jgi:psiF repeat
MNRLIALAVVTFLAFGSAYAADTKKTDASNSQQDKMKMCNDQAGDKKGDERKAFMKTCLSAKPEKAKSKMAMCNEKAKGMSKEEGNKIRSECMKAS